MAEASGFETCSYQFFFLASSKLETCIRGNGYSASYKQQEQQKFRLQAAQLVEVFERHQWVQHNVAQALLYSIGAGLFVRGRPACIPGIYRYMDVWILRGMPGDILVASPEFPKVDEYTDTAG